MLSVILSKLPCSPLMKFDQSDQGWSKLTHRRPYRHKTLLMSHCRKISGHCPIIMYRYVGDTNGSPQILSTTDGDSAGMLRLGHRKAPRSTFQPTTSSLVDIWNRRSKFTQIFREQQQLSRSVTKYKEHMCEILHARNESRRLDPVGQLRKNWNHMTIATVRIEFTHFSRKFT
jgi:hypothetical protein